MEKRGKMSFYENLTYNLVTKNPGVAQNIDVFFSLVGERALTILKSPSQNLDMIWILTPLILTMLLLEFYFGRYKEEELGWNTAFANALVLIFVAIDLIRQLYLTGMLTHLNVKLAIVVAIIFEGLLLTVIDFFHLLPKKIAFQISYKSPLNLVAIGAIILVYSNVGAIPLDVVTAIAFLLLIVAYFLIAAFIHAAVPKVRSLYLEDYKSDEEKE